MTIRLFTRPLTNARLCTFARRTSGALLLVIMAQMVAPSWAATEVKDAWQFTAFAGPYGKFKGTTTFDTALMDNGVFRYTLQGPNFDLFRVFNPENKAYIQTTVTAYAQQWAPSIKYPKLAKVGTGKMMGFNSQHFQGNAYREGLIVDAWYTNDIQVNRGLSDSFCRLCGLPPGYGMPVRVRFKSHNRSDLMFDLL
jgi:hypothetical protein